MNKLSLPEMLSYLLIGFILIGVCYLCRPCQVQKLCEMLGSVGTSLFAFVIGSLTFLTYRVTLYGLLILRFVHWINKDNVRDVLVSRYKINRYKADAFWKVIQESELKDRLKKINLGTAEIHLLYMTSCVTFIGASYLWFETGVSIKFGLLLFVSLVCGLSAVGTDCYIETIEVFLLKSIHNEQLDSLAQQLGLEKLNGE